MIMLTFDFRPEWRTAVVERREYLTNIIVSRDQTEQRRALRDKPRATLTYSIAAHGPDAARLEWVLFSGQPQVMVAPYWPWAMPISTQAGPVFSVVDVVGPLPPGFVVEDYVYLAGKTAQVENISHLGAGVIRLHLNMAFTGDLRKGDPAVPCWQARLPDALPSSRRVSSLIETSVTLSQVIDTQTEDLTAGQAPDLTVDGVEALIRPINWRDSMAIENSWTTIQMDAQVGRQAFEVLGSAARRNRSGSVLCANRDDVAWWIALFDRMKGRQGVMLAPSWQQDLPLQKPGSSSWQFEIPSATLGQLMAANNTYTHVFLKLRDGSPKFCRITDIQADLASDTTRITSPDWTEAYPTSDAIMACFAGPCRMSSDTLTINWRSDRLAEITIAVMTVEDNW